MLRRYYAGSSSRGRGFAATRAEAGAASGAPPGRPSTGRLTAVQLEEAVVASRPSADRRGAAPEPSERGTAALALEAARRYPVAVAGGGIALAAGVVLRFVTTSPLWLDEALTVHIARLPVVAIPAALRRDGAPPLYYVLLHFWMKAFGTSDLGVRSLSGVVGLLNLPLAWLAGWRIGSRSWAAPAVSWRGPPPSDPDLRARRDRGLVTAWTVTLLLASSPFAVYYDTESRMYALAMALSTLGLLAYTALLRRPGPARAGALALCAAALLYTHYWAFYVLAVVGSGSVVAAWRGPYRLACRWAAAALVLAGVAFLPWLPIFLFQLRHTGTPWAVPAGFTVLVFALTQLAGGPSDAGRALALLFFVLGLFALAGRGVDSRHVDIDLRTRPGVRLLAGVAAATLVLAVAVGKVVDSAFADRYTSVVVVLALVAVSYGVAVLEGARVRMAFVGLAVSCGLAASLPNAFILRTQAGEVAAALRADARPGDVVGYCPDQLGPAVDRALGSANARLVEITFPRGTGPRFVDWVNYDQAIASASPVAFARRLEALAGPSRTIFYVFAPGYLGFGNDCSVIAAQLAAARPQQDVVPETASDTPFEIFEGESLYRYPPR